MSDQQPEITQEPTQSAATTTPAVKTFTQAEMDAVAANARKEAESRARAKLLKELGIENADDPQAVETVKGKLTLAQQAEADKLAAENAAKSELQKAQEALAAAEKKAQDAEAKAAEIEAKRKADKLDSRLQALAQTERAIDPADVVIWLRGNKADAISALMDGDEQFNEGEAKKLLEEVRKVKTHWFQGARGAGSPSLSGGQTPGMDDKEARDAHFRAYRRGV